MTDHYRAFVYKQYYNYFEDTPYFESSYLTKNDGPQYNPSKTATPRKIKLNDGTIIETFSRNYNNIIFILISLAILIFFLIK